MAKWSQEAVELLKQLYKNNGVPSDELLKDPAKLEDLRNSLNQTLSSEGHFSSKEVADRLLKIRKSGKLPRLRS